MNKNKPTFVSKKRRVKKSSPFGQFTIMDYKDVGKLKRFFNDRGKINPRRNTGLCAKSQRVLVQAIKRAREMCLIPHVID